jgi:flagellar protein FlaG
MTGDTMSVDNIGHTFRVQPLVSPAAPAVPAAPVAAPVSAPVDTVELSLPSSPPEEVLDAVGAAADRAEELAADNRELHFEVDKESKRVIIQVRDLDGNVIRTIPPKHALDVMSGEPI